MNVNGIGTAGYQAWQGTRKAQQNAVKRSFAEQVNNVADTPKVYNIFTDEDMLWTGGNGTGLSYYLKYARNRHGHHRQRVGTHIQGVSQTGCDSAQQDNCHGLSRD